MNESQFLEKWLEDKSSYVEWGNYVVTQICKSLQSKIPDFSSFLKMPCNLRIKEDASLLDKAFYRVDKKYSYPYQQIEDKVGCRFVVLLVDDILPITDIIDSSLEWDAVQCRNFDQERNKSPLLFTYQSVHYVVKPKEAITINGINIEKDTSCEVQIRTLLQHAYAELTHDALYKAKTIVNPVVHRTVAKSMALIETTDDFFSSVQRELNSTPVEQLNFQSTLDELYKNLTGQNCTPAQKSSLTILDEFSELLGEDLVDKIKCLFEASAELIALIISKRERYPCYSQSIILFIIWLIRRRKHSAIENWPIDRRVLEVVASDMGESLDIH